MDYEAFNKIRVTELEDYLRLWQLKVTEAVAVENDADG